jgi:uncharacterized membrane protein
MEILNSYPALVCIYNNYLPLSILLFFAGIIILAIGIVSTMLKDSSSSIAFNCLAIIVGIILLVFCGICEEAKQDVYETRYEVILDGTMPADEFVNNYEVISQRGDILVVRDKNEDTWVE